MPAVEAKERIERQLQEAIDRLRADLVRVEIWACALSDFSRPIPDYQPGENVTSHLLASCSSEGNSKTHRERRSATTPLAERKDR
jgi:hypothetical protein